ncbi:MAG: peptide deformylase [Spirochaetales bacterium]
MEIQVYPAEILRRRASLVPDPSAVAIRAREMIELMLANDGIGLAAPQVGIAERFFVLRLPRDRERVFVNPEITERSRRTVRSDESCLSLPGISVDVERAARVNVRAWDEHGEPFELSARGLLARAIQHELDHLNGVLCIDRIDTKRRDRLIRRLEAKSHGTTSGTPS